ncbi:MULTISPECIES: hypothetical protein [Sorangium]|uniref:Uncharacterized protein n=1 Tax=Sorangium cellulosum TaxID=56 RepID=A0A4P2QQ23_SORCE|nr:MULTISPECIES: hypothetical protein [Sorangium]AUX32235.1 hypothetical protein SOCE836_043720 [Sorangium cellulosum]WCQ91607.1 hypothetical protein NQZ70_04329 [Sorangium sp. Soce836]
MQRLLLSAALGAALIAGCSTPFRDKRTPSGEFCSDMHVVPAGQLPDREYHRLQPIASDPEARTEAERLESLRKAACAVGGDAVIEAVNEEIRTEDGRYASVASGTAVIWVRRTEGEAKPLTFHPATKPGDSAAAPEPEAPPAEEAAPATDEPYEDAAAPAASATPGKPGQPSKPGAKPSSPSAATSAKPSSSAPSPSPSAATSAKPSSPTPPKPAPKK